MKHAIIGSGVIGIATGTWLEANGQTVIYNDIRADTIKTLKEQGHTVTNNPKTIKNIDITWICTAEWHVEDAIKSIGILSQHNLVIRSTTLPGTVEHLTEKYKLPSVAHVPEFLKASTPLEDIFNPDRIVIGSFSDQLIKRLKQIFKTQHVPILVTDPTTSELIKLTSNAWLSTQLGFWGEIYRISIELLLNPQEVANAVTLDKRISTYGSKQLGKSFGGFCLIKDLRAMMKLFEQHDLSPEFFKTIIKRNEELK